MSALLLAENIRVAYNRNQVVVDGVTFQARPGELVGIVGPNGSGKTTLVKALSRAIRPLSGSITLDGSDIWSLTASAFARKVAVVPQDTTVLFDLTVLEMTLLGRHPHLGRLGVESSRDEELALHCLDQVGASHLARRPVGQISGGERQRVVIARALAQEPSILLLDEPTSSLDISHQSQTLSLVSSLASEKGLAVVAVLHDLNLAAAWCRKLVALQDGRVAAEGAPVEVLTEANLARIWQTHMWVRRNPTTGRPFVLPFPPPYEGDTSDSGRVHVICGGGSGGPVISSLMRSGYLVTCGVVNVGDSDEELCRTMNLEHIAEAPFSPVSPEREQANLKLAMASDAIVLTNFCIGPGNLANLRTALEAMRSGKPVFRLGALGDSSDYTGGEGQALLVELAQGWRLVEGKAGLIKEITGLKQPGLSHT